MAAVRPRLVCQRRLPVAITGLAWHTSRIMPKLRPKCAWVIEWCAIGTSLKIKSKILHVLNPRLQSSSVTQYMQCLYLNSEMESGMDRIAFLRGDCWYGIVRDEGTHITVGPNPCLVAWYVKDLTIEIDYERSLEVFRWTHILGARMKREVCLPYHQD